MSDDRDSPLVSVVVPTYDRPDLLVDAVESVRAQTYDAVETVVVDDCSSRPATDVLAGAGLLADDDLRVVRHEENRGANAARNTGIRVSGGEFVAFLDDDDVWHPAKLERQVAVFRADPGLTMVYTGSRSVDDDGAVVARFRPRLRGDVTADLFAGGHIGGFSLVLVRRAAIEAAGDLDERFPSWQDREWYVQLSLVGGFDYVAAPLVTHRSPPDQISREFERKRDVSYPLFLEKHRPTARRLGRRHERRLVASLSHTLGASALKCGHHREAARYLARSLKHDPMRPRTAAYLLLALGGDRVYDAARRVKRTLTRRRSGPESEGRGSTAVDLPVVDSEE